MGNIEAHLAAEQLLSQHRSEDYRRVDKIIEPYGHHGQCLCALQEAAVAAAGTALGKDFINKMCCALAVLNLSTDNTSSLQVILSQQGAATACHLALPT